MRALVCSHVRQVALAARSLCATFKCIAKAKWTDLCLERAGESSLVFLMDLDRGAWSQERIEDVMQLIAERIPRSCFLSLNLKHFTLRGPQKVARLKNPLEIPAPMLSSLYISANDHQQDLRVTENFLGGHPSALRTLALLDISGISKPPMFSALRSLELTTPWMKTASDMEALVALLGNVPVIQSLTLRRDVVYRDRESSVILDQVELLATIKLPHLDTLIIADYIEHFDILLRVIPEPSHSLHVSVSSHQDTVFWSPSSHEIWAYVIDYVASLWKNLTGNDTLPNGVVTAFTSSSRSGAPEGALNALTSSTLPTDVSDTTLSFSCRSRIDEEHYLLNHISMLHLSSGRTGPGTSGEDLSGAAYLSALRRVVIVDPQTAVHLSGVEKWMKKHAKTYGPIERVDIRRGTYCMIGEKVEGFSKRIQKLKLTNSVGLYVPKEVREIYAASAPTHTHHGLAEEAAGVIPPGHIG
jgi:hypothetical protein